MPARRNLLTTVALMAGLQTGARAAPATAGVDSTYTPTSWGTSYTVHSTCLAPKTIDPQSGACGLPLSVSPIGTGTSTGSGPSATDSAATIRADVVQLGSAGQQYIDDLFSYLVEQDQETTQATNLQGDLAYAEGLKSDSVAEYALAAQAPSGSIAQQVYQQNAAADAVPLDDSTGVERNINTLIATGQQDLASAQAGLQSYQNDLTTDHDRITASLAQELADAQASGNSSLLATVKQQQQEYTSGLDALVSSMQAQQESATTVVLNIQQAETQIQTSIIAFRSTGDYGEADSFTTALQQEAAAYKAQAAQINEGGMLASDKAQAVTLAAQMQQAVGTATQQYVANVAAYNSDVQAFNAALNTYNNTISSGGSAQAQTQAYQAALTTLTALNAAGVSLGINPIPSSNIPRPA